MDYKPVGGGGVKFYRYEKGGGGVGGTAGFGVVLTQELEVLAIVEGLVINFHPIKRGARKFYPVLGGGGGAGGEQKPAIFPFCLALPPVINDQSLTIAPPHPPQGPLMGGGVPNVTCRF